MMGVSTHVVYWLQHSTKVRTNLPTLLLPIRESQRETERVPIHWFISQILTTSESDLDPSSELGMHPAPDGWQGVTT